jgi:cytochrome c
MEFFDNLVLPQSAEHIRLINYLLVLILFLFIPYIGLLLVTSILSLVYRGKGNREGNNLFTGFSAAIIRIPTLNKSVGIILGILPFLTITFMIAQIMHRTDTFVLQFLFTAFILGSIGIILIYTFRYSSDFEGIYSRIKSKLVDEEMNSELIRKTEGSSRLAAKSGLWGIILLSIGLWFLISAVVMVLYPALWNYDAIYVLSNWRVMLYALQFIALSSAVTGASILFAYYYWEGGIPDIHEDMSDLMKKISTHLVLWGSLALPLLMLIGLYSIQPRYLSGSVFAFSAIALILLLIIYNLVYGMVKDSNIKLSGPIFFLVIFVALSVIIKDQAAMANATKQHAAVLDAEYQNYLVSIMGDRGAAEVNGKELFDVRCSSCHTFDQKMVGPAYNAVLPKYDGNMEQLVSFIINPGRIDPAFPPMPNPGLKPNEARAVAEYIMETYKQ